MMNVSWKLRASVVLVATLGASHAAAAQRGTAAGAVVLVSIDGLKPEYVRAADSLGLKIPTLRALALGGASATGVVSAFPTVTYPNHTTMVTGAAPARHGIYANTTFDPLGTNMEGWYWYAEDIRVPTLWDAARSRGLTSAAVHWPVSVGAAITWNVPQIWRTGTPDDRKLIRSLSTPLVLDTLEQRLGVEYPDGADESIRGDERRARFVAQLIQWKRPQLTLAYLTALDHEEHAAGPWTPRAFAVLERIDAALDTIVVAARRSFGDGVTIAVVSDHGFAKTHAEVNLNIAFAKAGLIDLPPEDSGHPTDWHASAWPAGGMAAIVLRDSTDSVARSRTRQILTVLAADTANGIAQIVERPELARWGAFPNVECVVAFRPGWIPGAAVRGELRRAASSAGMHGYLPSYPEMRATFIIDGPGIAAGRSLGLIDMRDVAPTLAHRLGIPLATAEGHDLFATP
jgi:predicted AlkP superfamily pyrophosphatase or phosphodiesterase